MHEKSIRTLCMILSVQTTLEMRMQGLIQDYQLLVHQEGDTDMFQYFSTILYEHLSNS